MSKSEKDYVLIGLPLGVGFKREAVKQCAQHGRRGLHGPCDDVRMTSIAGHLAPLQPVGNSELEQPIVRY